MKANGTIARDDLKSQRQQVDYNELLSGFGGMKLNAYCNQIMRATESQKRSISSSIL